MRFRYPSAGVPAVLSTKVRVLENLVQSVQELGLTTTSLLVRDDGVLEFSSEVYLVPLAPCTMSTTLSEALQRLVPVLLIKDVEPPLAIWFRTRHPVLNKTVDCVVARCSVGLEVRRGGEATLYSLLTCGRERSRFAYVLEVPYSDEVHRYYVYPDPRWSEPHLILTFGTEVTSPEYLNQCSTCHGTGYLLEQRAKILLRSGEEKTFTKVEDFLTWLLERWC